MPNRIISKAHIFYEPLSKLSRGAESFYWRLQYNLDREGQYPIDYKALLYVCFPNFDRTITENDLLAWLNEMLKLDMVKLYEADGKKYFKLKFWPQPKRSKVSRWPEDGVDLQEKRDKEEKVKVEEKKIPKPIPFDEPDPNDKNGIGLIKSAVYKQLKDHGFIPSKTFYNSIHAFIPDWIDYFELAEDGTYKLKE